MTYPVSFLPDLSRTHKNCPQCRLLLPIEKFYRQRSKPDGRESWCKKCKRLNMLENRPGEMIT